MTTNGVVISHSRFCVDCQGVHGCGCSDRDWPVCELTCEDWDGTDCTGDREPAEPDLNAPDQAEMAHRQEMARRLK